jgi:glucosamine-6-phosphate deaminase
MPEDRPHDRMAIMRLHVFPSKTDLGRAAAREAADRIRDAVEARGRARIIAATGASQFEFLEALTSMPDVPWDMVEMFHLDEYIGLPATHRASFRRYLQERLIAPTGLTRVHLLDGEQDPEHVCEEAGRAIAAAPIDIAFVGIGENAHLAFNDPPADFETELPYLVVSLDEACRQQQVGEGWFAGLSDVPKRAISMSVRQILKSRVILTIVPDARKAHAVHASVVGPVSPHAPASILQTHPETSLYLDVASASRLPAEMLANHREPAPRGTPNAGWAGSSR